jgi:hypothetical protein
MRGFRALPSIEMHSMAVTVWRFTPAPRYLLVESRPVKNFRETKTLKRIPVSSML